MFIFFQISAADLSLICTKEIMSNFDVLLLTLIGLANIYTIILFGFLFPFFPSRLLRVKFEVLVALPPN